MVQRKAREGATLPTIHGTGNAIPSDDDALMLEALRIASTCMREQSASMELLLPGSPMVERLRMFAEQMEDVHARLSA